ncbi:ABC transporter permease [Ensifer sp. ENS05]|uniref:ABC transporter permease n=1 Tax=Ensifer sp. ENS05 TaxID=2769277 RepID=UPI001FEE6EC3|nr:ABC transporter permease [Ensifer sp. ENS05]
MVTRDPLVLLSAIFLVVLVFSATVGAYLAEPSIGKINIAMRSQPPFQLGQGWLYFLGSDSLGRSLLARIVYASRNTLLIAISAVAVSLVIGVILGIWAGYKGGWQSAVIMRVTDSIMSFPTLLLAILLLYVMQAQNQTIIIVLAVSRIPLFLRVARAEVLEVRERLFVTASITIGSKTAWILRKHVLPTIMPTLLTLAALEVAFVMLSESSLSFIGLGVQAPEISWGLLVSQGTQHLSTLWWLAVIPGSMIVLTALSLNILVSWVRVCLDPKQKWRVEA